MEVQNSTNSFTCKFYYEPYVNGGYEDKKAVRMMASVADKDGKVISNIDKLLTEDALLVSAHPEIQEGGFTRYGNKIKDPIAKFMTGIGACMFPDHPYAKALDAKNTGDMRLRVFDSVEEEKLARKEVQDIVQFLKEVVCKHNIPKKEAKNTVLKALRVMA